MEDSNGLPVPAETTSRSAESSPFRTSLEVHTSADLKALVTAYRDELAGRGWKETASSAKITGQTAVLAFARDGSSLDVTLTGGDDATILLVERKTAKARNAGLLPQAARARLAMGNAFPGDAVVSINGKPYRVGKGMGAKDPTSAVKLDLFPGKNQLVIKLPGKPDQKETVEAKAGEAWGLIILDDGTILAMRLY